MALVYTAPNKPPAFSPERIVMSPMLIFVSVLELLETFKVPDTLPTKPPALDVYVFPSFRFSVIPETGFNVIFAVA